MSVKEVIAALVKCDKKIFLLFPDVQQQPNSSRCGLFALACASTLFKVKDPTKLKFDFPLTRIHFLSCLQNKKFTVDGHCFHQLVPCISQLNHYRPILKSTVCCLPDRGDKMVCCDQCKEWFHFVCIGLDLDSDLEDTWMCASCGD